MIIRQRFFLIVVINLWRLLTANPILKRCSLSLSDENLIVSRSNTSQEYTLDRVNINLFLGLISHQVEIQSDSKSQLLIKYLKRAQATAFSNKFNLNKKSFEKKIENEKEEKRKRDLILKSFLENQHNVYALYDYCKLHLSSNSYLTSFIQRSITSGVLNLNCFLDVYSDFKELEFEYKKRLDFLNGLVKSMKNIFENRNHDFEVRRLNDEKEFFDNLEIHPLTKDQQKACIIDDNWNLILASAGSGKTSVIVGKVGILLKNNEVNEKEILVLSFAKDASLEIDSRINQCLKNNGHDSFIWAKNISLKASTFHRLGCQVIRESCKNLGKKPPSIYSKSDFESQSDIKNQLIEMLYDDKEYSIIILYLVSYQVNTAPIIDINTEEDYDTYIENNSLTTLKYEDVKSYDEYKIANYLFLNDIDYVYEKPYIGDLSVVDWKRGYRPDFTIKQGDRIIYLEHYGVDEKMNPPAFFKNRGKYVQGILDKRVIHKKNGTDLIETYSFQVRDGTIENSLREQLQARGVKFSKKPNTSVLDGLKSHSNLKSLAELLYNFLNQFKSSRVEIDTLQGTLLSNMIDTKRAKAFYRLFEIINSRYELFLRTQNKIDFNDMINVSIEHIERGEFKSPFKRILVDEFQDISKSRMKLVQALVKNGPDNTRAFCVGDDFQAIFAFTGCDIAYIKYFKQYFDQDAKIRPLYKTFRFKNKTGEIANHFIEKNPFQNKKPVITHHKPVQDPTVCLVKTTEPGSLPVSFAMKEIIEDSGLCSNNEKKVGVLVLTRYNKSKNDEGKKEIEQIRNNYIKSFPNLQIDIMTCHASKGQGKDYVIILDLTKKGFPCKKTNDPLLSILNRGDHTHGAEKYPNAEERRLFYVAITRSKEKVFMVVNPKNVSEFVIELLKDQCDITQISDKTKYSKKDLPSFDIGTESCPACDSGILELRGSHFYCSRNPVCKIQVPTCTSCGEGIVLASPKPNVHACQSCGKEFKSCHRCDGWLIEKTNRRTKQKFMACSFWFVNGCKGTSKIYRRSRFIKKGRAV